MSTYEDSIKCKYCSHFERGANRCHLYYDFDQSLDKSGGPYLKETSPDSRCSHFFLTAMDAIAQGVVGNRPDGSPIVSLDKLPQLKQQLEKEEKRASRGCYVATCVYGCYDCPQVWTLRRFRDNTLSAVWHGRAFIRFYYAVSPTLVKWFGHTTWFKRLWRGRLDALVRKLQAEGVEDTPYTD
ncbi:MAG: CFI-box-CTERM domain-containing protein [Faecousia sp.]